MGTSKGYIAPTTPHWSQAKRAVTSYIASFMNRFEVVKWIFYLKMMILYFHTELAVY